MSLELRSTSSTAEPPVYCAGHPRFTEASPILAFQAQGETIVLEHHPDVFPPSAFGLKFAEHIDFKGCDRAFDVGTGTGLLAILAAKKGIAEVMATDTSPLAIKLTDHNARVLNSLEAVKAVQGHFFSDCTGKFDVITANLPQEILPPDYRSALSDLQTRAIDGEGIGGNQILLSFLDNAPQYMHASSNLYVIVNTITDYRRALDKIEARYNAELVWSGYTPVKSFVRENMAFYRKLVERDVVHLVQDDCGDWRAKQFIYRLTLPR